MQCKNMNERHLGDIGTGDRFRTADHAVTESEIIEYAKQYDPQPFHTDPAEAHDSVFGGLVASGWHTTAITMRLVALSEIRIAGGLIGLCVWRNCGGYVPSGRVMHRMWRLRCWRSGRRIRILTGESSGLATQR